MYYFWRQSSTGWFASSWEWSFSPGVINVACVLHLCRECKGEAHEPCDCDIWKLWLHKVSEMRPEERKYQLLFTHISCCRSHTHTVTVTCRTSLSILVKIMNF